jgi:hypothetical protein
MFKRFIPPINIYRVTFEMRPEMYNLHVNVHNFFPLLKEVGKGQQVLVKLHNIKFHENPFSCSQIDTLGQTTDMSKVTGIFCSYSL